ncbi:glycosyltransferase family 2 protein [Virgibacillus sp. Bac330]|uniref:glycosyltransferase family 2 protein n=1 Tax=Virgibacillus sp. Bac330 TaxID=2419841 RepID=UPI000EF4DB4B|nr:glycosyltransferase family 2 protein [Virgibacillus sp. Bac330]
MNHWGGELDTSNEKNAALEAELANLNQVIAEKKAQQQETREMRIRTEAVFQDILHSKWWKTILYMSHLKEQAGEVVAALIGKRDRRELYSRLYRRKKIDNQLKSYRYYLYNLGFTERVINELKYKYKTTTKRYERRAIAWELALWYASFQTEISAEKALKFIPEAKLKDAGQAHLRKLAIVESECHLLIGNREKAKTIIYHMLDKQQHPDLFLAAVNVETNISKRLDWINKVFTFYELPTVTIKRDVTYYDGFRSEEKLDHAQGMQKVTIIVPVFNAAHTISTTLDSLIVQTWKNLEIIVVDDCSKDQTKKVVEEHIRKDQRIRLLTTPVNSGPYVARNIGLQAASGGYITVNDADDWAHPKKIEIQVAHLIQTNAVANMSQQVRITEQITAFRRGLPGYYIFNNMSSLMFDRNRVVEKVGYWDTVRFAGDSEYVYRLKHAFGDHEVVALNTGPLSFQRQTESSLTNNQTFGYSGYLFGTRKEYAAAYRYYHHNGGNVFFPPSQETRLFVAPQHMQANVEPKNYFDIVIAGDFRHSTALLLQEIKAIHAADYRIALMQMDTYCLKISNEMNSNIRAFINENYIPVLTIGDVVRCEVLLIRNAEALTEKQAYLPDITPNMATVVLDEMFVALLMEEKKKAHVMRKCAHRVQEYFNKKGKWLPYSDREREQLNNMRLKYVKLSFDNWGNSTTANQRYMLHLQDWIVNHDVSNKGDGYNDTKAP